MKRVSLACVLAVTGLILGACGSGGDSHRALQHASVPAELFGEIEAPASDVVAAKNDARQGDVITVNGRIAGRRDPFTEGRAIFLLADVSLPTCDERPEDKCPTPWDLCCELPVDVAARSLTVQVAGDDSQVLRGTLQGVRGLVPGAQVRITGKVVLRDDQGKSMTIEARKIHVK